MIVCCSGCPRATGKTTNFITAITAQTNVRGRFTSLISHLLQSYPVPHSLSLASMVLLSHSGVCLGLVLAGLAASLPTQVSFDIQANSERQPIIQASRLISAKEPRKLHGRFLHITDMHPDPHYTPHSSRARTCHSKKPQKKSDEALYFGTPFGCVFSMSSLCIVALITDTHVASVIRPLCSPTTPSTFWSNTGSTKSILSSVRF